MKKIWTAQLDIKQRQMVQMPEGAEILSLVEKYEFPHIYFLVDIDPTQVDDDGVARTPLNRIKPRIFSVVCAGEAFEAEAEDFIGTLMLGKGGYIAHVFEHPATGAKPFTPSDRYKEDHADLHRVRD